MTETKSPKGWVSARFEEILIEPKSDLVDGPFGSNLKSAEYVESGIPVLKIQNIKADRFVRSRFSFITESKSKTLARHSFIPGDLIVTKLGNPLGLCCEVPHDFSPGVIVADLMRLRLRTNHVSKRYVLLVINSQIVQSQFKKITKGTTRPRVNLTIVRGLNFPLPPLAEQKRIVTKIEELFSKLDAGEESFKQARKQLGIYRQSLLKQAFEGKLTEQWRADHPDQLEDPEILLARIQQEREASFANELREWKSAHQTWINAGEIGKKPPKPKNHKVLFSDESPSSISFPDAWNSFNLSELVLALRQGWSPKCHNHQANNDTWSVMTTTAIQPGTFIQAANKELPDGLHPRPWITLNLDDVLITRAGPRSRCGIVCRVTKTMPRMMLCDKAYRLRFPTAIISPKFIELLLISPDFSKSIEALKTGISDSGVNITQNGFMQLKVSLPSNSEQQEIVRILEEQFTVIEQNEREIDAALKRSEALRQSILKRAFYGQLVPQDPNDEPASELLARIQAERAEQEAATKNSKKKTAKKKTARKLAKKS